MQININNIFNYLHGKWQIDRKIDNLPIIKGLADFCIQENNLLYREELFLELNQQKIKSTNSYLCKIEQKKLAIYFNECINKGKLFNSLDLSNKEIKANHLCSCDLYISKYYFINSNKFIVSHKVNGPKKDYSIINKFTKQAK